MRARSRRGPLSLHAIAGSHVVLLGINMDEEASQGVLGFAIHRTDHRWKGGTRWLTGFRTFPGTRPTGSIVSTQEHPVQMFTWSDLEARPSGRYTYRVVAMRGEPGRLRGKEWVSTSVSMENEDLGTHAVFFNRGAAGSQAYVRRFGNRSPREVEKREASRTHKRDVWRRWHIPRFVQGHA